MKVKTQEAKEIVHHANGARSAAAALSMPAPAYEPKPAERVAVEAWFERRRARPPAPRIKIEKKGDTLQIALEHPHPETASILLAKAVGTTSADFLQPLISQLVNAGSKGRAGDEEGANFMLAVVKGIEPRDEVEAMLAAQMAAVHMATMTFARRLNHVDNLPQQDSAERAFNKLARTFTTQVEALKRYRTGGEQRVTVQHVNVNDGGQAIVGNMSTPGGGSASEESRDVPMNSRFAMHDSPRCSAMSKRTRERCRAPALTGWCVCRFHGARGGGPKGKRNGMYRHGRFRAEAVATRSAISALLRQARASTAAI